MCLMDWLISHTWTYDICPSTIQSDIDCSGFADTFIYRQIQKERSCDSQIENTSFTYILIY